MGSECSDGQQKQNHLPPEAEVPDSDIFAVLMLLVVGSWCNSNNSNCC
jgi:hypothetical protein